MRTKVIVAAVLAASLTAAVVSKLAKPREETAVEQAIRQMRESDPEYWAKVNGGPKR